MSLPSQPESKLRCDTPSQENSQTSVDDQPRSPQRRSILRAAAAGGAGPALLEIRVDPAEPISLPSQLKA